MKKIISAICLMGAISAMAVADSFKELDYNTSYGIGNFDTHDKQYSQWLNEITGKMSFDDEWKGLAFNFHVARRDFYNTDDKWSGNTWDTDFNIVKQQELSKMNLNWTLGFKYADSNELDVAYFDGLIPIKQPDGHGYEFYFGPEFDFKLFGQTTSLTPRVVYYNEYGQFTRDYKDMGTEGIGGDLDFAIGGLIAEGKYGEFTYGLQLNNHFRKPTEAKDSGSDEKNSVYLNYIALLTYSSPRFSGFGFDLNVVNQWEKFTGDGQRNNGLYVSPKISYAHTFDITNIGKLTVSPYASYNIVDKQNREIKVQNREFRYTGNGEATGGIEFSLER